MHDLIDTLPVNERYSYVFEGNSEVLDHILVSDALFAQPFEYDPVHVNSEFDDQASDHEPQVVRLTLNRAPTVSAGGPYSVDEGSSVTLTATGSDPDGDPLTYAWDLDNNGTFETAGQTASYAALDGPATKTVAVRATDPLGASSTSTATVNIANVAPSATFHAPATASAIGTFTLSLTNPSDPSSVDTAAGFEYAFDCGSGYGAFGTTNTTTCQGQPGPIQVGAKIRDKDGGTTEYTARVNGSIRLAKQQVLDAVNTLLAAATDANVQAKLRDAAKKLADSLDSALWVDALRLNARTGDDVFNDEKQAADKLPDALAGQLVLADIELADVAISDAAQAGVPASKLADARAELAKARAADNFERGDRPRTAGVACS